MIWNGVRADLEGTMLGTRQGMPAVTACAGGHPDDVLTCKLLRPVGPSCAGSAAERAERPQGNEHNRLLLPI